jgi:hypothetical protein
MPRDVRHGSNSSCSPFDPFLREADAYHRLGKALERAGVTDGSYYAYSAAAELDYQVPELRNSWGGAFNGQECRQRLVVNLLEILKPAAFVETGTFRGSTTKWVAERFDGPILTCEIEVRYYLFACKMLAAYPQVNVSNEDTRTFLRNILPTLDNVRPVIFYLDAHWKEDLPLEDELRQILFSKVNSIIMIDDFEVPSDPGYGFDDYGPGKCLSLSLLLWAKELGCRFFFPTVAAADETGERRGACLLARQAAGTLATLTDWREASSHDWEAARSQRRPNLPDGERNAGCKTTEKADSEAELLVHLNLERKTIEANWQAKDEAIARLSAEIEAVDADRQAKDAVIARVSRELEALHADRNAVDADRQAKDAVIARVSRELEAVHADRNAVDADRRTKDEVIARLSRELEALHADRSAVDGDRRAKDEVIARLSGELEAVDADRRAKDEVIARLSGELEAVDADRRAKDEVIAMLDKERAAAEARSVISHLAMKARRHWTGG